MKVTMHFLGSACHITKIKEIKLNLMKGANLRDLVVFLCKKFPELLGRVINPETFELIGPYMFSVNGRHVARSLDVKINEDDKILLLNVDSGG